MKAFDQGYDIGEYTAFAGERQIASGDLLEVAEAAKRLVDRNEVDWLIIFNNDTGQIVDLDYRGNMEEFLSRIARRAAAHPPSGQRQRGRGRPRLGVVAGEVTLLPRQWEWLKQQPGGASATLRRLVQNAMRASEGEDRTRRWRDATYRFMSNMAGDAPGFEEAARALYRSDFSAVRRLIQPWPPDIRAHAERLLERLERSVTESHATERQQ